MLAPLFDRGPQPCVLREAPYGANMAFRKEMFEKYGFFRTDMGARPVTESPGTNEDIEFGRRLMAAGERLRYEPSAILYHPIAEDRVQKSVLPFTVLRYRPGNSPGIGRQDLISWESHGAASPFSD